MDVFKLAFFDFLKELILIFGTERVVSLEHHIKENTERPHIGVDRGMVNFGDNFRGHISGSAAESIDGLIFGASETESKVNQFKFFATIDQNIFSLDVSVDDIPAVQILQSFCDHKDKLFGLILVHSVLRFW